MISEIAANSGVSGGQKAPIIIRRVSYSPVPGKSSAPSPFGGQRQRLLWEVINRCPLIIELLRCVDSVAGLASGFGEAHMLSGRGIVLVYRKSSLDSTVFKGACYVNLLTIRRRVGLMRVCVCVSVPRTRIV